MKGEKKKDFEYKLIHEKKNLEIDKLFKIYKKDPYIARVVFQNDPTQYIQLRIVSFEQEDGSFQIIVERKKYGISITNRIYSSNKRLLTISYKADKKQFWLINNENGKYVLPLSIKNLSKCRCIDYKEGKLILDHIQTNFTWLRYMREHSILAHTPFNTVIRHKLYGLKKALQYQYKVPIPVAKILHAVKDSSHCSNFMKYYLKWMKNIENFNAEWLVHPISDIFYDTLKMAKTLDRQVNCSWSTKRLKVEHDKWAEDITEIIFTHGNRTMDVHSQFLEFAKWSRWEVLTETKEMAIEGKKMKHCVATYVSYVENHSCAIFHVEGHTLQLRKKSNYTYNVAEFYMGQFYGYANAIPPIELTNRVKAKVNEFNSMVFDEVERKRDSNEVVGDDITLSVEEFNFAEEEVDNDFPF